jgi:hypothetical protein
VELIGAGDGQVMPGSEEEAAGLLDAYLTAQRERAKPPAQPNPW